MITEADIQTKLNAVLAVDDLLVADWGAGYAIGTQDPVTVDKVTGKNLSTEVLCFIDDDGTLGGTGYGRANQVTQIAVMIYVFMDSHMDKTAKPKLMNLTARCRQAVMRNRNVTVGNTQYWHTINIDKTGSKYFSSNSWRGSVTIINILTQQTRV